MKNSQLKGIIKNMENKHKRFSYTNTMKILDVAHYMYIDTIKKYDYSNITNYKKSKYIFYEIANQFEAVYDLLNKGQVLIGTCLLRNIYEEIMYIMATSVNDIQIITPSTNAGYFRDQILKEKDKFLSEFFSEEDIKEIYSHLSKIMHITNLKEITSYFVSTKKYNRYISNDIKYVTILIEFMYIDFLNKMIYNEDYNMLENIMLFCSYVEIINFLYFMANSEMSIKHLSKYYYGENNQNYLKKKKDELTEILKEFKVNKKSYSVTIKKLSRELNKQIKESKYFEKANEIVGGKIVGI